MGRVVQLVTHVDPSDMFGQGGEREIVVQWHSDEWDSIHVRASLEPADYLAAINAHATGRSVVMSGILERRGRRWVLTDVVGFSVYP